MVADRALKTLRFQVKLRYGDQGVILKVSKSILKLTKPETIRVRWMAVFFFTGFYFGFFLFHKTQLELLNPSWSS